MDGQHPKFLARRPNDGDVLVSKDRSSLRSWSSQPFPVDLINDLADHSLIYAGVQGLTQAQRLFLEDPANWQAVFDDMNLAGQAAICTGKVYRDQQRAARMLTVPTGTMRRVGLPGLYPKR